MGPVDFWSFFALFVPSLVNWLVPAVIMMFAVPAQRTSPTPGGDRVKMRLGARRIIFLFLLTIAPRWRFTTSPHAAGYRNADRPGLPAVLRLFPEEARNIGAGEPLTTKKTGDPSPLTSSTRWRAPEGTRCFSFMASYCASAAWASSAIWRWHQN